MSTAVPVASAVRIDPDGAIATLLLVISDDPPIRWPFAEAGCYRAAFPELEVR